MAIEDEGDRRDDYNKRAVEEARVELLVLLQRRQDDEAAMILGNIKHKVNKQVTSSGLKVS